MVLTVPARVEFGDVARRAAGELARRQGFDNRRWAELETAVDQTLRLLRGARGERIRFRFVAGGAVIVVEAELTDGDGAPRHLCRTAIEDLHATLEPLVDSTEVDGGAGLVRFVSRSG